MENDERSAIRVVPRSEFDAESRRGRQESAELADGLLILARQQRVDLAGVREVAGDRDDEQLMKGDPITIGVIVLALVNAGALTGVIECIKGWLNRKPTEREVTISGTIGDHKIDLTVTASNVDSDAISDALVAAIESGGGG